MAINVCWDIAQLRFSETCLILCKKETRLLNNNCCLVESKNLKKPIMAADELQFAVWRMMDYKQMCRTSKLTVRYFWAKNFSGNDIKLKCSSIVAALLTEEEKMEVMGKVSKMFFDRMEDFHQMTPEDRNKSLQEKGWLIEFITINFHIFLKSSQKQDAARNMAEDDQETAFNPLGTEVDIEDLNLNFN